MARWQNPGHFLPVASGPKVKAVLKSSLVVSGVVALLLLSACGDDAAQQQASSQEETATAPATAIDPAQAPEIQKGIESYLAIMEGPADQRVMHHGAVKVTPESDAFAVAIEGVRIGTADKGHLAIGTVTYRLVPKGTDTFIASDLSHATSFPFRNADGTEAGSLALTTTSFTGEWSSSLQSLLTLDWQAKDIVGKDTSPHGGEMRASSISAGIDSTDKGDGLYDQQGQFTLTGFSAKDTTGGEMLVEKIAGSFGVTAVKLKDYVTKTREMQSLMASLAEAAGTQADGNAEAVPPALSPEEATRLSGLIKDMSSLIGGVSYAFDFEKVIVKEADGREPFGLHSANFDLGLAGLNGEKASISFGIGHDGLVINDPNLTQSSLVQKLIPAKGSLAFTVSDVPSQKLWTLIGDQFPTLLTNDQNQAEAAMNVMVLAMAQLLQESQMKVTLAPSELVAEILQVNAEGLFDVLPEAAFGLVGALDVDVRGLDEAMQMATDAAQSSPEAAQIVGGFAMIQSLARRETDSDGKPIDKLKIEVDAMGDTKVNGVSMSGM